MGEGSRGEHGGGVSGDANGYHKLPALVTSFSQRVRTYSKEFAMTESGMSPSDQDTSFHSEKINK